MARVACRGLPRIEVERSGSERHGLAGQARQRMERTGLERTDRQGVAGTEWRMQIDGERLGRAGFVVAGMEGGVTSGFREAQQARCVKTARSKLMQGELRQARCGVSGIVKARLGK